MDLTEGSETSAKHNLTPGKYPKVHTQDSEHGENLKSRMFYGLLAGKLTYAVELCLEMHINVISLLPIGAYLYIFLCQCVAGQIVCAT
jgi:hypothetical protein